MDRWMDGWMDERIDGWMTVISPQPHKVMSTWLSFDV